MRLQINEYIYIETDHIESADVRTLSVQMVSGNEYSLNSIMFQTVIETMKNKDAVSNVVAY